MGSNADLIARKSSFVESPPVSCRHMRKEIVERISQLIGPGFTKGMPVENWVRVLDFLPVLCAHTKFPSDIPEYARMKMTDQAVRAAGRASTFTESDYARELQVLIGTFKALPTQRYLLTTTLSLARPVTRPIKRKLDDVTISIVDDVPKFVEQGEWVLNGWGSVNSLQPSNYARLYASTLAKEPGHAAQKIFNQLSVYLALINLWKNRNSRSLHHPTLPINKVRLGPHQCIHYASGKFYRTGVWHQLSHKVIPFPGTISDAAKFDHYLDAALSTLRTSPLRELIRPSLSQYNEALDSDDKGQALLKLWSALELLTDTTDQPAKITIRRASFLSADPKMRAAKLAVVAEMRNRYVHLGANDEAMLAVIDDMRGFIETVLSALLGRSVMAKSREQFIKILDLPVDKAELKQLISLMRRAKNLL